MKLLDKTKALSYFRIVLYLAAAYIVYDSFAPKSSGSEELRFLKFKSDKHYEEFFIRFNHEDSVWNAISLQGTTLIKWRMETIEPWRDPHNFIAYFSSRNLSFQGFLLNDSMALDNDSFLTLASKISTLNQHSDPRLAKLNDRSPFTAYFLK